MAINIPDGIYPFFISNSGAEKYDLKAGPDILDLVPHKSFNTAIILEDIKKYGFMSAFEPCAKNLKKCKLEEFLIVCDTSEKYSENFLLLFTEQAIESYKSEIAQKIEAQEAKDAEESVKEEVHSTEEIIVQIKTEFVAKDYCSATIIETIQEINENAYIRERPLTKLSVIRKDRKKSSELSLDDYSQNNSDIVNIMPRQVPDFDLHMSRQDVAVQVVPELRDSSVQTKQNRKTNKAIQYETIKSPYDLNHFFKNSKVSKFLTRVFPDIERALQENETVDIFFDTLQFPLQDDVSYIGNECKTEMKELRKCTNLEFSKGKKLSIIDWDPNKQDIVATSINDAASFDQRILSSCYDHQNFVIVWDLSEWVHSNIILKSITECRTFKFNSKLSNVLVGGCMSGQVVLWDLKKWNNRRITRKYTKHIEDNAIQNEPLKPSGISHPEFSHQRAVSGLIWLPHNLQFNAKGKLLSEDHLCDVSYQFITASGDGQFLIWDTRFEDISIGKLPHIAKPKPNKANNRQIMKDMNEGDDEDEEFSIPWLPLMRIKPKRPEGIREQSICKMIPLCRNDLVEGNEMNSLDFKVVMSSEEGHIMLFSLILDPKSPKKDNSKETDDEQEEPEYIIWIAHDNTRPCVSLSQSPFFPELIASVSDHNFNLWNIDKRLKIPIFSSPDASSHLSDGVWSPVRPGLLFLSKIDGTIDIWDFTDSSYSPNTIITVTSGCITSLSFEKDNRSTHRGNKKQEKYRLAVGDSFGSLHILEVPEKFSKCLRNEIQLVKSFLEREIYHGEKFERSSQETESIDKTLATESKENSGGAGNNTTQNSNLEKNEEDKNEEEKIEVEYRALEKTLLSEFNIEVDNELQENIPEPELNINSEGVEVVYGKCVRSKSHRKDTFYIECEICKEW